MNSRERRRQAARERVEARLAGVDREDERPSGGADAFRNKVVVGAFCVFAAVMLVVLAANPSQPEDSASNAASEPAGETAVEASSEAENPADSAFDPSDAALPSSLDPALSEALLSDAVDDADVAFIVEHASEYGQAFGLDSEVKLLELAAEEPDSRAFVKSALDSYPQDASGGLGDEPEQDGVPQLFQWDPRWALVEYSSAPLGLSGCAPTSMAMVYSALTGNSDRTPADMAALSRELGCMDETDGTYAEFFETAAPSLGLEIHQIPADRQALLDALSSGALAVCNVGPGDFTDVGHFLVILGVDENGDLRINDPFSKANSERSWDVDVILGQTMGLYAARSAS